MRVDRRPGYGLEPFELTGRGNVKSLKFKTRQPSIIKSKPRFLSYFFVYLFKFHLENQVEDGHWNDKCNENRGRVRDNDKRGENVEGHAYEASQVQRDYIVRCFNIL